MGREALIVGNTASYTHGKHIAQAAFLNRTLNRIAGVLEDLPALYAFHATTLLDKSPTEVRQTLDTVAQRAADSGSLILFYYFGHGVLSQDLELLLIHPGGTPASPSTLRLQALEAIIAASDATKSLFILDCCYAGAYPQNIPFTLRGQHCRLASSTPSARSYFMSGKLDDPIGVFTQVILDGLTSNIACRSSTDNSITAQSLFDFAVDKTQRITGGIQVPLMLGNLPDVLTEFRRVPDIIPGISSDLDEKTGYRKILAIVETIRANYVLPDIGSIYDLVLENYPDTFQTLHKNPNGSFEYFPVQEAVIYRYVRFLRSLGLVKSEDLSLTASGRGLTANSARNFNSRLLQAIDFYLGRVRLTRDLLDQALSQILSSRSVPSRDEVLDYLTLGGYRFHKNELALILDLLGYLGALRMSSSRAL